MMQHLWTYVRNFNRSEFACKCGTAPETADLMNPRLVFALDSLRALVGRPFIINSAYRTEAWNKLQKGAPASAHLEGLAVDIKTSAGGNFRKFTDLEKKDLLLYARKLGFTGIGISPSFVHLDMRARHASWRYQGARTIAIPLGDEIKYI
jgi:zinc D-Ala-D-Ala carboxypeptidase